MSVWDLTADNLTLELPVLTDGAFDYDFTVDWGDGNASEVTNQTLENAVHAYADPGSYTVVITGIFPAMSMDENAQQQALAGVPNMGRVGWQSLNHAFSGCENLTLVAGGEFSNVTTMASMFEDAPQVQPRTNTWSTGQVTSMKAMFKNATNARPDTANWNTANVTEMYEMFAGATIATPDTSAWQTGQVTNMGRMFQNAVSATPDTSSWDTSRVVNMYEMFDGATSATPETGAWNTDKCRKHGSLILQRNLSNAGCQQLGYKRSTNMFEMFAEATMAVPDTSTWNTENVENMGSMFRNATQAAPNTSGWNTANVEIMGGMFLNAAQANPVMSSWQLGKLTTLEDAFTGSGLTQDNYTALLVNLGLQNTLKSGLFCRQPPTFAASAQLARNRLVNDFGWQITDGGVVHESVVMGLLGAQNNATTATRVTSTAVPTPALMPSAVMDLSTLGSRPAMTAIQPLKPANMAPGSCRVCDAQCQEIDSPARGCGDGQLDAEEACDDGNIVTEECDYGQTECTVCSAQCTLIAGNTRRCGDGNTDPDEEACDDGNDSNTDSCTNDCLAAVCGDGFVYDGEEACDDGNAFEECAYGETECTVCSATCELEAGVVNPCGDGEIDEGEECDDGDQSGSDGCSYDCKLLSPNDCQRSSVMNRVQRHL